MLTMYAVKHYDQELYLPWVKGSNSKAELCDPREQSPRLFKSYKGASQAMRAWAKGIHRGLGQWEYGESEFGSSSSQYFSLDKIIIKPQKHRRLDEVCVVKVIMHVEAV